MTIGSMRGTATGVDRPDSQTSLYSAAGLRIGLEAPIGDFFALRIYGDSLGTLTRTRLRVQLRDHGWDEVWTTPSLSGTFSVALLGRF